MHDLPRIETVEAADEELAAACAELLGDLSAWFGIPEAIEAYPRSVLGRHCAFARDAAGDLAGFLHVVRHFPGAAEVHVVAVAEAWHRRGLGSALLAHVEAALTAEARSEPYERTRAFYLARGFEPLAIRNQV